MIEASTVWDGITRSETLGERAAEIRHRLADRARAYDWGEVLEVLRQHPQLINTARPGGRSLYAPLHQTAHGGAPADVISRLLAMGAWRTLRNAGWERPVDVARARKHRGLIPLLEPVLEREVPPGLLLELQERFHEVIRERANDLVEEHALRLPELEPLLETETPRAWFAVPGMYGGFDYRLENVGVVPKLVTESWCRVVEGSGQRHEVTAAESRLVAEGFV